MLYQTRHIGGVPFFSALSVGERVGVTGKDVILATVLAMISVPDAPFVVAYGDPTLRKELFLVYTEVVVLIPWPQL